MAGNEVVLSNFSALKDHEPNEGANEVSTRQI